MPRELNRPSSWSSHHQRHRTRLTRYLLAPEWATEWVVYALRRWAFVDLLALAGNFALLATLVSYCMGTDARSQAQQDARKARQYQAWQVITNAQGKPGNGGRTQALEDLARDSVDLSGVDISHALLEELSLPGAKLWHLNAAGANLEHADLRGANLMGADLSHTDLTGADLRGAELLAADFTGSSIAAACLDDADLNGAHLDSTILMGTSFLRSDLVGASFQSAQFAATTVLDSADFEAAVFKSTEMGTVPQSAHVFDASFSEMEFWGDSGKIVADLRSRGAKIAGLQPLPHINTPYFPTRIRGHDLSLKQLDALYPRVSFRGRWYCKMPPP